MSCWWDEMDQTIFPGLTYNYMFAGIIGYIITVLYMQFNIDDKYPKSGNKSLFIKSVLFIHNIALCLFSCICFITTFPIIMNTFIEYGWKESTCKQLSILYSGIFGKWAYYFYLSKYYEFMDTYIIIFRGRKPSMLQVKITYIFNF